MATGAPRIRRRRRGDSPPALRRLVAAQRKSRSRRDGAGDRCARGLRGDRSPCPTRTPSRVGELSDRPTHEEGAVLVGAQSRWQLRSQPRGRRPHLAPGRRRDQKGVVSIRPKGIAAVGQTAGRYQVGFDRAARHRRQQVAILRRRQDAAPRQERPGTGRSTRRPAGDVRSHRCLLRGSPALPADRGTARRGARRHHPQRAGPHRRGIRGQPEARSSPGVTDC
jgi:hypothetical protein